MTLIKIGAFIALLGLIAGLWVVACFAYSQIRGLGIIAGFVALGITLMSVQVVWNGLGSACAP